MWIAKKGMFPFLIPIISLSIVCLLLFFGWTIPVSAQPTPPVISSLDPASGSPGTTLTVTINGSYFTGASSVSFEDPGITVLSFTINSSTMITAHITISADAGAGGRVVSVTTPAGTCYLNWGFDVTFQMLTLVNGQRHAQVYEDGDFIVRLQINKVDNLSGFDISLTYNPDLLEVIGIEGGDQGVTPGLFGSHSVNIDDWRLSPSGVPGTVRILGRMLAVLFPDGVTGQGYLAEVHFHVKSATAGRISNLILSNTEVWDYLGNPITASNPLNGSVSIVVTEESDATLSSLTLSDGTLVPDFSPGTSVYNVSVGGGVTSVRVTPTTNRSVATVSVNSIPVISGTPSQAINLSFGTNTIYVRVTAQKITVSKIYTIVITRIPGVPSITSVLPSSGPTAGGTGIIVTGTNLISVVSMSLGGIPISVFNATDDNHISATTPPCTAGSKTLVIYTTGGSVSRAAAFTYVVAPRITSFSPLAGGPGTALTITGSNFNGATSVTIGGTPAASFSVSSPTYISARVSNGSTGKVTVTTPGGTAISSSNFIFYGVPTISSFTPVGGTAGTSVVVTGTNFTGATSVRFGGIPASSFSVNSPTQITALVGSGATGSISVNAPGGSGVSPAIFTYYGHPSITAFSPGSGGSGTTVTISGTNFGGATSVTIGGTPVSGFTVNSGNQIIAVVGNGSTGKITVTTPGGTNSSLATFSFYPAPAITSFTPSSGGSGTSLTINGANFSGASAVKIGDIPAASFTLSSSTRIIAKVGTGATGKVSVTALGGAGTSANDFTYYPAPVISAFSPSSGKSGTVLTITGSNFTGASSVKIGTFAVSQFRIDSPEQITATAGSGTTGKVSVITPGGTATSLATFTFILPPTVSSFTPTSGKSNALLTIRGTNLSGSSSVTVGGTPVSTFTVVSSSQITATVGNGSTGKVSVTNPGGTATSAGTFTYYGNPSINSFSPTSGQSGTLVTINGANFSGATAVKFGGISASSITVKSATQIIARVGSGASGKISITTPGGSTTSTDSFIIVAPPRISSFTPSSGSPGSTITITGTNFIGTTAVKIGTTNVSSFDVISATRISAVVGNGASGRVSVTTPGGSTTSYASFTIVGPPSISSFTPTAGKNGTYVKIYGTNLKNVTAVKFGGVPAASYIVYSTYVSARVGSGASGPISITAQGLTVTSSTDFTFSSAPTISDYTPHSGGKGTNITINGRNFSGATSVKLGAYSLSSFTVNSTGSQIIATLGAINTGTAASVNLKISVTTPGGSATTLSYFTYYAAPSILSFSPASGTTGTSVVIKGSNLASATSVTIGGTAATIISKSSTQITVRVGVGSTGRISVSTPGGTATSTGTFTHALGSASGAPAISSITPSSGTNGTSVVISGSNLSNATAVMFGSTPAGSFTTVSNSQINATVGAGSSGQISVTTPGGTATSASQFTYNAGSAAPSITSFTPSSGTNGTSVVINGSNLSNATAVMFGATTAGSFTIISNSQINATVGAGSSGQISVTTPEGTATGSGSFTYIAASPPPAITSFTPASGSNRSQVVIFGANLRGATSVTIGGTPATIVDNSKESYLVVRVGVGATGKIVVITSGGIAQSTADFFYQ